MNFPDCLSCQVSNLTEPQTMTFYFGIKGNVTGTFVCDFYGTLGDDFDEVLPHIVNLIRETASWEFQIPKPNISTDSEVLIEVDFGSLSSIGQYISGN